MKELLLFLGKLCLCADATATRESGCRQPSHRRRQRVFRVVSSNSQHQNSTIKTLCTTQTASAAEGSNKKPRYLTCTTHPVNSARSARTGQLSGRRGCATGLLKVCQRRSWRSWRRIAHFSCSGYPPSLKPAISRRVRPLPSACRPRPCAPSSICPAP